VGQEIDASIAGVCLGLKFSGAVAINQKVYLLPSQASRAIEYDLYTQAIRPFGDAAGGGGDWAGGALGADGKIYCVPSSATRVLRIDPENHTTRLCMKVADGPSKWSGCVWDAGEW
jgi:hypothetical protein